MAKHSDKALQTLTAMGTAPADWKQADIRWVHEKRTMLRPGRCPTCEGNYRVWTNPDTGEVVPRPADMPSWRFLNSFGQDNGLVRKDCQTCRTYSRSWGWRSTGKVPTPTLVEVMVGYPIWPEGCRFDSRFRRTVTERYCCELCSKSLKSYQVPCVGRGSDGVVHGMWVGTDCAKKFLPGVQFYPPAEAKEKALDVVMDEVKGS